MPGRLLGAQLTGPHQIGDQAVVVAHLLQSAVGVAVDTTVADVGHGQCPTAVLGGDDRDGADCRTHSGHVWITGGPLEDGPVGPEYGHGQAQAGVVHKSREGGGDRLGRCHLAAAVPAHSVGEDVEPPDGPVIVLIGGPYTTHVRHAGLDEAHRGAPSGTVARSWRHDNSSTMSPTRRRSPVLTIVGSVTLARFR